MLCDEDREHCLCLPSSGRHDDCCRRLRNCPVCMYCMQSSDLGATKALYVLFRVLENVRKRPLPGIEDISNFLLVRSPHSLNAYQRIPQPNPV